MPARLIMPPLAVAGVALIAFITARQEPGWSLAGDAGWPLAIELSAALALAVAGMVVRERGPNARSGVLLIAAAAAWLAAEWNSPAAPGAIVFTIALLCGALAPSLVAHGAIVHGRGRLATPPERVAVVASYVSGGLMLGLAGAVVTDVRAQGCGSCPANLVSVIDAPALGSRLQEWGLWLGAPALAATAALALVHLSRSGTPTRRAIAPVILPAVALLALVVADYTHDLHRGYQASDEVDQTVRLAEAVALLGIAAGVGWQRLAARRIRARLARVVVDMADAARPGELRTLLASVLDDPTLEILYAGHGGWIDAAGHSRPLPDDQERARTSLMQDGDVVAVIVHRRGLLDDHRLVDEVGHAARLALDHERLQAQLQAHAQRLQRSRTAIVAAADRERRRLERDLHDGAQQGLAGLAMAIGLARTACDERATERMEGAQAHVRAALDRVRTTAHSLYPAALGDAGLAAALDVLTEWRPHVELGELPDGRFERIAEAGAYFIIATLTQSPAAAAVSASRADDRLVVEVRTSAQGDLVDVRDRVGALGGRLDVHATAAGETLFRAELPCA